jgi:hypothetical protein
VSRITNITVEQMPGCQNSLALKELPIMANTLPYGATYDSSLNRGSSDYFAIQDNKTCPIQKCELRQRDCIKPLVNTRLALLKENNNWVIAAPQNITAGYSEYVCFECLNVGSRVQARLNITQISLCYSSL